MKTAKRGRKAGVKQYPSLDKQAEILHSCIQDNLDQVIEKYVEQTNDKRGSLTKEQINRLEEELSAVRPIHLMLALQASQLFTYELLTTYTTNLNSQRHYDLAEYHMKAAKRQKKIEKGKKAPEPPEFPESSQISMSIGVPTPSNDELAEANSENSNPLEAKSEKPAEF
ncbi:MAG: hypothetical protein HQM14_10670 [SAR324 cluster bacterium]|nr:hypothetical protein [SAR324 cluster bacterium]